MQKDQYENVMMLQFLEVELPDSARGPLSLRTPEIALTVSEILDPPLVKRAHCST
jgi:hypothetical protein